MMAPSISSSAAIPSSGDPLSQASPSSSSASAQSAGQKHFTSSPLSPSSSRTRRSLERDLSDFSETSITSSSSTVGPLEEEGDVGELSDRRRDSGGGGGGGWMAHASTDRLHSPIEDDDRAPIIRKINTDGEGSEAGSTIYPGQSNGFTRSLGAAMEEETDTEEQREAKHIQSNLERWAAAERQRRKAARTSRMTGTPSAGTTSGSASSGGASLLGRRLTFGRRNTITQKPSDPATPGSGTNAVNSHLLRRGSISNSVTSSAGSDYSEARSGGVRGSGGSGKGESGRGIEMAPSLRGAADDDRETASHSGYTSDASSSARRKGKGKAVDETDPWRPPSAGAQRLAANEAYDRQEARNSRSNSPDLSRSPDRSKTNSVGMKPSASRPIVTPGRAASIRRPATQTPQIVVASDEANATDGRNPFMTRGEVAAATAAGIAAAMENGIALRQVNNAIPEGDEGDEDEDPYATDKLKNGGRQTSETVRTATPNLTARPRVNGDANASRDAEDEEDEARSKRFSTSSKFREIGLNSREDFSEAAQGREGRHNDYDYDNDGSRSISRPYSMTSPADYAADLERGGRRRREEQLAEEDRRIIREGRGRQTWWTEWLCGCGRVIDDDNEQTGKTGPE